MALPTLQFQIATLAAPENKSATLVVTSSAASGNTVSAHYGVAWWHGRVRQGLRGVERYGEVPSGQTTANIPLTVLDDLHYGPDKTVLVSLSSPVNASLGTTSTHTHTIQETDAKPNGSFKLTAGSVAEGQTVNVQVGLSSTSQSPVTVNYAVTGGTAASGTNFTLPSGTLTFNPGDLIKSIPLTALHDLVIGTSKTVVVTLSSPGGATLGALSSATWTIADRDPQVGFAGNASGAATQNGSLTVSLNVASTKTITVAYAAVAGGTAVGGVDFSLPPGTLTFHPGDISKSIPITVVNHGINEPDKTINVALSTPINTFLGTTTATYTIQNAVAAPTVAFLAASSTGAENVASAPLAVKLSAASGNKITVHYAVTGGTAVSGANYTLAAGTLTFLPGQTTANIPLVVKDDLHFGIDKTVVVTLSSPTNATLGATTSHTRTIQEIDPKPAVSFQLASGSVNEGKSTVLKVALSSTSTIPVTVDYAVTGGTGVSGTNFTPLGGTLTFNPGDLVKTITLSTLDDLVIGDTKTVKVGLSNVVGAKLGAIPSATLTLVDQDPQVGFTGNASGLATTNGSLTVSLNVASTKTITVAYAVAAGGTAVAGVDFALPAGTLTFHPGDTSKSIPITVMNHGINEPDKTIKVALSTQVNSFLGASTATYTILNVVAAPTVAFASAASTAAENVPSALLPVVLSAKSGNKITVHYAVTAAGTTAVSGVDYALAAEPSPSCPARPRPTSRSRSRTICTSESTRPWW